MKNNEQRGNILVIIIMIVAVLLIAGGVYYFLTISQKNDEFKMPEQQVSVQNSKPAQKAPQTLSAELETIQIDESDSSFSQLDQDLKDL